MSHFYLTLPSNSSATYYPNNTLTNFTTKLHHEISLQDEWEVALTEIIFPKNWHNVDAYQFMSVKLYDAKSKHVVYRSSKYHIKAGYYSSLKTLVQVMNEGLRTFVQELMSVRDELPAQVQSDGFAKFEIKDDKINLLLIPYCEVTLGDDLLDIFGFDRVNKKLLRNMTSQQRLVVSNTDTTLNAGRHTFYVYCDILENVPVGDTLAPLLKTIGVEGERGSIIHKNFDRARYIPIQKKHFDSLEINIRDGFGRAIPFQSGTLIVTLHFRRARQSYFL